MKAIVDTAVWSLALRRGAPEQHQSVVSELGRLIADSQVVMLGPIRQELLSGMRDKKQFERLRTHLRAFPDLPLEAADYEMAADFFNICRAKGVQGSNTDFLICAAAVRRKLMVYTTDQDFTSYRRYTGVNLHG